MKIEYGLLKIIYTEEDPIECADSICGRFIATEQSCYVDTQNGGNLYCEICGTCERYHRKKAAERKKISYKEGC